LRPELPSSPVPSCSSAGSGPSIRSAGHRTAWRPRPGARCGGGRDGRGDWDRGVEITGPILRLRALGDEDEELRYYAAVDDGSSERIRALRIGREQYERLAQGRTITVRLSPNFGRVRWIIREEEVVPAGVG
jgi:hypothetical protein